MKVAIQKPFVDDEPRLPNPAQRYLETGQGMYEQDIFWKDAKGLIRQIVDLTPDHRRFIARMLVDQAASRYCQRYTRRRIVDFWAYMEWADDHDAFVDVQDEPDSAELLDGARREMDAGMHLDWMRGTPLFRRMVEGLDWLHPGVLA